MAADVVVDYFHLGVHTGWVEEVEEMVADEGQPVVLDQIVTVTRDISNSPHGDHKEKPIPITLRLDENPSNNKPPTNLRNGPQKRSLRLPDQDHHNVQNCQCLHQGQQAYF